MNEHTQQAIAAMDMRDRVILRFVGAIQTVARRLMSSGFNEAMDGHIQAMTSGSDRTGMYL